MAKPKSGKQATEGAPKSGASKSGAPKPGASKRITPKGSGRYTPPVPKSEKVSPIWVPILMFVCLLGGMMMIILNYVDILPGGTSNGYLLGGLALITVGFITATRYH